MTGRAAGPARGGVTVSVVIVAYESGPALVGCVESLQADGSADMVVVDNGSTDGSVVDLRRAFPQLNVVVPGRNLGYGSAANRGVAATSGDYVLVCNPDLTVSPGAVGLLVEALRADDALALVGPLIRTPEGGRYPSVRQFPSLVDAAGHGLLGLFAPGNRFTRSYRQTDLEVGGVQAADWVSGACFLVKRAVFEDVGGFDEAYFMYAEDVDLCWRLGRAGWAVAYVAAAEVTHLQGVSTDRHPYRMILEHHRSLLRFAVRSTTGWRRMALPLVVVGVGTRAVVASLHRLARF